MVPVAPSPTPTQPSPPQQLRHLLQESLYTKDAPESASRDRNWNCRGRRVACVISRLAAGTAAATVSSDIADTGEKLVSIRVHSWLQRRSTLAPEKPSLLTMNETHREDPHAPLSYYGARRIVWLVFFVFIIWLILRALQPVILLFALVFLLAMVLNPIVVWLQKHRVPRFVGVILVMLALIAVTTTIILFAIPPLSRQLQELMHSTPNMWQGIRTRIESLTKNYPEVREALPRTDEMAGKVGAAAATVGNFLLQSTLGLVGGVASALLAILLLVFVLANPRPLVTAYLALAPDRYREQARRISNE